MAFLTYVFTTQSIKAENPKPVKPNIFEPDDYFSEPTWTVNNKKPAANVTAGQKIYVFILV